MQADLLHASRQLRANMMQLATELASINRELLLSKGLFSKERLLQHVDNFNELVSQLKELFQIQEEYREIGIMQESALVEYIIKRRMQRVAALSERVYIKLEAYRKKMRVQAPLLVFDSFGRLR